MNIFILNKMAAGVTKSLPRHVEQLLNELTFIGLTQPGQKICFSTRSTTDGYSLYSYLYRRWYQEGENTLILNLTSTVGLVEEALETVDWESYRIQILTKVIDLHRVLIDQITIYERYPYTKASLIGLRDRVSTILLNISDNDKLLIKRRQNLEDAKFTVNVIGTPPGQSPLATRLANER